MLSVRNLLIGMCVLLFSVNAQAAPASAASIEKLLQITKTEALLESMYGNVEASMRQAMIQSLAGKPVSPEQKRLLDDAPKRFVAVMREELSWAQLKPMYVQIYRDNFTQEEINGLIAFYDSPAGRAFVTKMPVVMQQSMSAMQTRIKPFAEKMRAAVQQAIAESKAVK